MDESPTSGLAQAVDHMASSPQQHQPAVQSGRPEQQRAKSAAEAPPPPSPRQAAAAASVAAPMPVLQAVADEGEVVGGDDRGRGVGGGNGEGTACLSEDSDHSLTASPADFGWRDAIISDSCPSSPARSEPPPAAQPAVSSVPVTTGEAHAGDQAGSSRAAAVEALSGPRPAVAGTAAAPSKVPAAAAAPASNPAASNAPSPKSTFKASQNPAVRSLLHPSKHMSKPVDRMKHLGLSAGPYRRQ
jgi:hypothetical protein